LFSIIEIIVCQAIFYYPFDSDIRSGEVGGGQVVARPEAKEVRGSLRYEGRGAMGGNRMELI